VRVVLTGAVDPALCCSASGIRPGLRFLDGGTHFLHYIYTCINIYTGDHCLSHSVPFASYTCLCTLSGF
jgi:hypothetical protein